MITREWEMITRDYSRVGDDYSKEQRYVIVNFVALVKPLAFIAAFLMAEGHTLPQWLLRY